VGATALTLGATTAAHAAGGNMTIWFSTTDYQSTGYVEGDFACYAFECPVQRPLFTMQLERGGQVVASGARGGTVRLDTRPQPGDIARILVDGVERASAIYDGNPSFDNASCSAVGQRTLTGHVTPSHTQLVVSHSLSGVSEAGAVTRSGDTFSVSFNRALAGGTDPSYQGGFSNLSAQSTATQTLASGDQLTIRSWANRIVCPNARLTQPTGPKLEIDLDFPPAGALKKHILRPLRKGRYTLPGGRIICPKGVPRCDVGVGANRIGRRGQTGKPLGSLLYKVPGGSTTTAHGRFRSQRLARKLRGKFVMISVVVRVPPGPYQVTDIHGGYPAKVLAPRRR
jgi:hypothetical protein